MSTHYYENWAKFLLSCKYQKVNTTVVDLRSGEIFVAFFYVFPSR